MLVGEACTISDIMSSLDSESSELKHTIFCQLPPRFEDVCLAILILIQDNTETQGLALASLFKAGNVDAMFELLANMLVMDDPLSAESDMKVMIPDDQENPADDQEQDDHDREKEAEEPEEEEVDVLEVPATSASAAGRHRRLTTNAER